MRVGRAFVLLLLAAAIVPAAGQGRVLAAESPAFGAEGIPRFDAYYLPEELGAAHDAAEPTIGIPWDTDSVFFQAGSATRKAVFDDATWQEGRPAVSWSRVSPLFTVANVDPMLHADYRTGRIWAGGLAGPCSLMGISDDDGATWTPAGNMCSGPQFDHQSIGSGPWSATASDSASRNAIYPRATYYCAQLAATACATSLDGGRAWLPFTEVLGGCGGLHGHIAVSEPTGFAAVPHGGCGSGESPSPLARGNLVGFAHTSDNGVTWSSRVMPDSVDGVGFDPDLAFSQESGWLWLAQADDLGVHVALSKDEGVTWETLGASTPGVEPSAWLALNTTFHDPDTGEPLVYAVFPDLEAGDDLRVALAFMATTDPEGKAPFTDCGAASDPNVWHYYLSQSFDGGAAWTTVRLSEDPVQIGAIWNGGGNVACRNLLDFNDMDMDSEGRLHIAFADGCTEGCAEKYAEWRAGGGEAPDGSDSRDAWGTILRQTTGRGLLAAHDKAVPSETPAVTAEPGPEPEMPGPGLAGVAVAVAASAALLRRRR